MKIYLFTLLIGAAAIFSTCTKKTDSRFMGVIETDDSTEAQEVPGYAVSIVDKIDSTRASYCNGVKLQDGRFLSALHCFRHLKAGSPVTTSGGIANEVSREKNADLFIGQMVGGIAPSEGAKVYDGTLPLPLSADLEAHWFDPFSGNWRISKGHATRSSANDIIWRHDLDLNPGASGAGLFYVDERGERFLVGIHLGHSNDKNVALVITGDGLTSDFVLPNYKREGEICVGNVVGKDSSGKPVYEWSCTDGGEGGGGTGESGEEGPEGGNPSPDGIDDSGPEDGNPSSDGNDGNNSDDEGGNNGGVTIGYPGGSGNPNGGNTEGDVSGENTNGAGSNGNTGKLENGRTCYACNVYTAESDKNSLFKPECDQDSGFTGLFGQDTPSTNGIHLKNLHMSQTELAGALRSLAEKMLAEKKWKTPEGMPSKISQLSDETIRRLETWLNQVIKSADDYYAMIISSLGSVSKPAEPQFNETEDGIKRTRQYLEFLKKRIAENPDEFSDRRYSLLDASAQLLKVADIQYKTGNVEQAYIALQMSIAAADVSISVTPVAGWAKDVYEGWTGYSFTSGKKLTTLERSLAIGGAVTVGTLTAIGASGKVFVAGTVIFRDAAKISKSAEQLAEIEKATESLIEMSKSAEKAGVSAEMLGEGIRSTQKVLSAGKHVETVAHDGRTVYKLKELEKGAPKVISEGKQYDGVRQKIAQGWTNRDLMKSGNAPIGSDGKFVNLHHVFGAEPGAMIEMEATAHTKDFAQFHQLIKDSFRKDAALRAQYAKFRREYWMNRL
ncbi:MAG: hypothetical protein M3Q07_01440 [Pseudobdellovibrionaceae bacterium]|nr:hypothetical protein [Pseudobdellovibrionaceae bacterium]